MKVTGSGAGAVRSSRLPRSVVTSLHGPYYRLVPFSGTKSDIDRETRFFRKQSVLNALVEGVTVRIL